MNKNLTKDDIENIGKMWSDILVIIQIQNNESKLLHYHTLNDHHLKILEDNIRRVYNNTDITARKAHEIWLQTNAEHGYKYGVEKSTINKTHPCMVDFDELNFLQKLKDELFVCVIKTYKSHK